MESASPSSVGLCYSKSDPSNDIPPPPPNPSQDGGVIPHITSPDAHVSPVDADGNWNVDEISPEAALKRLSSSLQALADLTGDVPPTPPISRPGTPRNGPGGPETKVSSGSRPATPVPADDIRGKSFKDIPIGRPEASACEPSARSFDVDAAIRIQQVAIARKFFCKKPPPISVDAYLMRLQRYCPMSPAVYLAAGVYIYKLVVEERLVPVTERTVHRLVLASLRVAMKALEDLRYPQSRFAGVGGVSENELKLLEISLCYLTDFDLQVDKEKLYQKTVLLQQAAEHTQLIRNRVVPIIRSPTV